MDASTLKRLAQDNLAQVEAWRPSDDFGRRMRALNISQIRAYLADVD